MDVLNKKLNVMDSTATTLCMDNKIPIVVYNMNVKGNLLKVINQEKCWYNSYGIMIVRH